MNPPKALSFMKLIPRLILKATFGALFWDSAKHFIYNFDLKYLPIDYMYIYFKDKDMAILTKII